MAKSLPIESKHVESSEVDADDVVIINRDTDDGPEHCCWRPDAKRPPTLMDSINNEGQINEVLCRKVFVTDAKGRVVEQVEVVCGVDRTASVREINRTAPRGTKKLPLRIRLLPKNTTDAQIVAIIEAENARRKKDTSPIQKAEAAKRMLTFRLSDAEILRVQGLKTMESLMRNQALLTLSPTAQKAVDERKIKPSVALTLKDLPREVQDEKVAEWLGGAEPMPSAKKALHEAKEAKKAPEERSKKDQGEVGPPGDRLLGRVARGLKKIDDAQEPSPVSDLVADVIYALYDEDETTRGSLPPDVQATLRWIRTGKGVKDIDGFQKFLKSLEKPKPGPSPKRAGQPATL